MNESNKYIKDFDGWNERIKNLNNGQFNDFFYEREIWWCALGTNVGSEQDGKNENFERPVLIIKKINKDLLWILPLTSKTIKNEYRVSTENSFESSQIILSQIRAISSNRLLRKVSKLKVSIFQRILVRLSLILLKIIENETPP